MPNPLNFDQSRLPKPGEQGYAQYQDAAENMAEQSAYLMLVTRCEKDRHNPAKNIWSCGHCGEQDPVNPDGIVIMPKLFYLCMTCYKRYQNRALNVGQILKTGCWDCIIEEWFRLSQSHPDKLLDLRSEEHKNILRIRE